MLVGLPVGLKLPEAPFALGFAAALAPLPRNWQAPASRVLAAGVGGLIGVLLYGGYWYITMYHLTGNPLFPYFNEYWQSPLALAAPYRDLRFVPHAFLARRSCFPSCSPSTGMSPTIWAFQDIRVMLAYLLVIAAVLVWLVRRAEPRSADGQARTRCALFAFSPRSYFAWLRIFAIYRYIILLEMLAPLLIVGAVGLLPLARAGALSGAGGLACCLPADRRAAIFWNARRSEDPYVQVALPPDPRSRPHHGADDRRRAHGLHRHHPAAADSGAADRRLDGAAARRHRLTDDMMRRVAAHLARAATSI